MEKINWTDHVRNEDILLRVKEQRNILHKIRKRNANWIVHILRINCLLQRVIERKIQGGIEMTGRRVRKRRKLLDNVKERRGYSHLKEEALGRSMWRAGFGRGFGLVVRQTAKLINELLTATLWIKTFPVFVCNLLRQSCLFNKIITHVVYRNICNFSLFGCFWNVKMCIHAHYCLVFNLR